MAELASLSHSNLDTNVGNQQSLQNTCEIAQFAVFGTANAWIFCILIGNCSVFRGAQFSRNRPVDERPESGQDTKIKFVLSIENVYIDRNCCLIGVGLQLFSLYDRRILEILFLDFGQFRAVPIRGRRGTFCWSRKSWFSWYRIVYFEAAGGPDRT